MEAAPRAGKNQSIKMTQADFKSLPFLLLEHQVAKLGYDRRTLGKLVDCAVLSRIAPKGCTQGRYQKRQLAQLLHWEHLLAADEAQFRQLAPLLPLKPVRTWTGYTEETLSGIVHAHGLTLVKPPGMSQGKFLKAEIAKLIGFEHLI